MVLTMAASACQAVGEEMQSAVHTYESGELPGVSNQKIWIFLVCSVLPAVLLADQ